MSSSDSEETDLKSAKSEPLKQQAPNAVYNNFLNANNKFTEMLKNKIKQSGISPIAKGTFNDSKYDFNPVASSTQIGTPNELKPVGKNKNKEQTIIEINSTIASNTSVSSLKGIKAQKRSRKGERSSGSDESTSNTDSDDSSRHRSPVKIKRKFSSRKKQKAKEFTSDMNSSDSEERRKSLSLNSNKKKPKKEVTCNMGSSDREEIWNSTSLNINKKKIKKEVTSDQDSSDSEEVRKSLSLNTNKKKSKKEVTSNTDSSDNVDKKPKTEVTSTEQIRKFNTNQRKLKKEVTSNTDTSDSEEEVKNSSSLNSYKKKQKKEVTSDTDSSDSEKETTIPRKQKKTQKRDKKSSPKRMVKASTSTQSSSSSEEEKENINSGKKNIKSTLNSESDEKNKGKHPKKPPQKSSSSSSYSSSDEFVTEKVKIQLGSPDERLKDYENEACLQRITDMNNFLKKVKPKEELFLLQVPIKLDPQSLVGVNISLSEQIRISQHKKYESVPSQKSQESLSLFCNDDDERIRIVKPMGYITIQRRLKKQGVVEAPEFGDNPVLFPSDLKERHPLFGSNFTNKISLEENIKQKLAAAVESYNRKREKEAKEKKRKLSTGDQQQQEEIFKFLSQPSDGSTSKKAKNSTNETYSELQLDASTSYASKKKNKKKGKRNRSDDEEDTTGGIKRKHLDGDVNVTKTENIESTNSLIQQLLFTETETLYKKKKKKRKKSEAEDE